MSQADWPARYSHFVQGRKYHSPYLAAKENLKGKRMPNHWLYVLARLAITITGAGGLYLLLFYGLRSRFRRFEKDIALVTLNVSAYPALLLCVLICLKITLRYIPSSLTDAWSILGLHKLILAGIIIATTYWTFVLFQQVLVYYLKEYAETTEVMWDEVLIPLLEGIMPVLLLLISGSAILELCFGLNLTGAWLTLGGGAFVIGLAVRDILANFFSGIVLLIDSPFRFGDVLRIENDGEPQLGMLRKIGVRVTHLYLFESSTEVYIPNSLVQSQKITNLSRPIEPVFFSTPIEFKSNCDLENAKLIMQEIIQAHPDTLGTIETKLDCLDRYYCWESVNSNFSKKKENGRQRLLAEQTVNKQLDRIEDSLEALSLTLQFVEKGGLNQDEIATVQAEYETILQLIGITITTQRSRRRSLLSLPNSSILLQAEETSDPESLISLVRSWYRLWLRDPDVVDQDEYVLSELWERKIELLKRRACSLCRKILNPLREETRLDDYVQELAIWLKARFKQARSQWQNPLVCMDGVVHIEGQSFIRFTLNYYVDDIRLEDGKRGIRINSDIHREIMAHLKEECQIVQAHRA